MEAAARLCMVRAGRKYRRRSEDLTIARAANKAGRRRLIECLQILVPMCGSENESVRMAAELLEHAQRKLLVLRTTTAICERGRGVRRLRKYLVRLKSKRALKHKHIYLTELPAVVASISTPLHKPSAPESPSELASKPLPEPLVQPVTQIPLSVGSEASAAPLEIPRSESEDYSSLPDLCMDSPTDDD